MDKSISDIVRCLRNDLGLTQEKLAAKVGVSFPTINRWEKGKAVPSQLAMRRLEELREEIQSYQESDIEEGKGSPG